MRNVLLLAFVSLASAQVLKKCPAPPEYPHTSLDKKYSGKQAFSSGEKVYYNCAEDFSPSKGGRALQCVEGTWTKLTLKCEKKSCGNAGDLLNGQFEYEGNSYLGEKVYAVCNEGYTLKGVNYLVCKKSGWTGDFPSCEEGEDTCPPPAVAHSVSTDMSVYRVGDNLTFTCSPGFQLDGPQQITCGPGGLWQAEPPRCVPSPDQPDKAGGCGAPLTASTSNANLADKFITMTSFASNFKVYYVCDVGYVQAGGSRYRKCVKGKWTRLWLRCERKLCGSAGEIVNGQFRYSGVEFGDTATAVCDVGYRVVGRETRNCLSKGWDGRVPICQAVECEEPPQVMHAEMESRLEPPFTYRSVVRYHCRQGTLHGAKEVWCMKDGKWSAPPTCEATTCPPPNVPGGLWAKPHNGLYRSRDAVSIECPPGHTMTGPSVITCGGDGRWSPGLPTCTPSHTPAGGANI